MSMTGIRMEVTGNIARVVQKPGKITSGTVGLPVEFSFDSQWDSLRKVAVFQAGDTARVIDEPRIGAVVPWEVLAEAGAWLCIGVYGINENGTVVIPTVWAGVGMIEQGVRPDGDPSTDPTLPIWQEMMNRINRTEGSHNGIATTVCTATPENLASVIANAKPNTTIELTKGNYDPIVLLGYKSYPENLTIKGGNGAVVAGVQISSGLSQAHYFEKLDISESIMPGNLSFVNLYFTGDFALRNCGITGLTIRGCYFGYSAGISICPNDLEFGLPGQRYDNALVRAKDLVIRGNTITNAANEQETGILVLEAENAFIYANTIQNAAYNGIQVSGRGGVRTSTGQIGIGNNTIKNTGSRSIRVANLDNARVVILGNQLHKANKTDTATDYIKVSGCTNSTVLAKNNLYEDGYIGEGFGYTFVESSPVATEHTHRQSQIEGLEEALAGKASTGHRHSISDITYLQANLNAKADTNHNHTPSQLGMGTYITKTGQANGMHYRKYSDGTAECWGIINVELANNFGCSPNLYNTLPLSFTQFDSVSVTNLIWESLYQPEGFTTQDLLANSSVTVWNIILHAVSETFIVYFGNQDGWGQSLDAKKLRLSVHIWGKA